MRVIAALILSVLLYGSIIGAVGDYLSDRPIAEKVGVVPNAEIVKLAVAEQAQMNAAAFIFKALVYFGSIVEPAVNKLNIPPDYKGLENILDAALILDPYNMDGYYFSQAILVWDMKNVAKANALLERGMAYRTWDWYLPFFAGFNYAYFLRDYENAAKYYQKAGELSGAHLYSSLAGRYLYEAGKVDLAIAYLTNMVKGTRNKAVRSIYEKRLLAFKEVKKISRASDAYAAEVGKVPSQIEDLVNKGYLNDYPVDPYGGKFYFADDGQVRSTSNFARGKAKPK